MESHLTYSRSEWDLVLAVFVMAAFALLGGFVYLISTKSEISARYRASGLAGAVVCLVAFSAYLLLTISWLTGFRFDAATGMFSPSDRVLQFRNAYRYVDWSVTVPLLCVEVVMVSKLAGAAARKLLGLLIPLAWLMIVTGFFGADTFDSNLGRLVWGLISTAFFIPLYLLLLRTTFRSARDLGTGAGAQLKRAGLVLALTWGVYPVAYCVPFFFADSPGWAVGRQIAFTLADIAAKVGFGLLIHATAKHRTAEDVTDGTSPATEPVFATGDRLTDTHHDASTAAAA